MWTNTYLMNSQEINVDDKFTITIELFRKEEENKDNEYLIDVHIWWELWTVWTTKSSWILFEHNAIKKFDEFVEIANNIKSAFEL